MKKNMFLAVALFTSFAAASMRSPALAASVTVYHYQEKGGSADAVWKEQLDGCTSSSVSLSAWEALTLVGDASYASYITIGVYLYNSCTGAFSHFSGYAQVSGYAQDVQFSVRGFKSATLTAAIRVFGRSFDPVSGTTPVYSVVTVDVDWAGTHDVTHGSWVSRFQYPDGTTTIFHGTGSQTTAVASGSITLEDTIPLITANSPLIIGDSQQADVSISSEGSVDIYRP